MINVYGQLVDIGSKVSFKIHSLTDNQTYRGVVRSVGTIQVARVFEDVNAIHNSMRPEVATLAIGAQTFLIVETSDGVQRPFAIAWVDGDTFTIEDTAVDRLIVVRSVPANEVEVILNTIRTLGYDCNIYRAKV